jgi:hypothetical protein
MNDEPTISQTPSKQDRSTADHILRSKEGTNKKFLAVLLVLIGLIIGGPALLIMYFKRDEIRFARATYERIAASGETVVSTNSPYVFDFIIENDEVAARIEKIQITSLRPSGDYSSLSKLPNVRELELAYVDDVRPIIPAINKMPSLQEARLYYCGPKTEDWLPMLIHSKLEFLEIHQELPHIISDEIRALCAKNLPKCKIELTNLPQIETSTSPEK